MNPCVRWIARNSAMIGDPPLIFARGPARSAGHAMGKDDKGARAACQGPTAAAGSKSAFDKRTFPAIGCRRHQRPTDTSPDFVPIPDRWRLGLPEWNRYERSIESPYVPGRWWDPYNQNVLKGD